MKKLEITRFPMLDYAGTEALNTLCTNLSFLGSDVKRIMITSAQASEGKSFLSMSALRTFAGLGKRVVLVDTDLRRSAIAGKYGVRMPDGDSHGLSHYLAGMCGIEDVMYATKIPNAYMVPIGREVASSLSLLNTPRLSHLLEWLAAHMDFVLVDAPPVGLIIDAAEIAKSCDGAVFAVNYNRVRRRELLEAKQQIEQAGCRILGAVLNNVDVSTYTNRKYYNKSYYSRYGSEYVKSAPRTAARPAPSNANRVQKK